MSFNDIVKNTELFINIMGMSRTSSVQKWDHEAFQRAFRWAHYFEQIHRKTKDKPTVAEKISKHLTSSCSEVDTKLGLQPITYDDLPRVSQILRKNLLENPNLNNEFFLQLIGQLKDPPQQEIAYKKQLQALSKLKATLQILQLIQKRFEPKEEAAETRKKTELAEEFCTAKECTHHVSKKSQIKANASLLRKCLLNVIGLDYSAFQRKKQQLHTKLDSMLKHDCGLDVLLSALLCEDEEKFDNVTQYILEFIEDILVPKWKVDWKDFLQYPLSNMFGLCSEKYGRFCEAYLDTLGLCGDRLQDLLERHDYMLLMEKKDMDGSEQLCNYFYFLLLSHLQKFARVSPTLELKLEAMIRDKCEDMEAQSNNTTVDSNVWLKVSRELMIPSVI